MNINDLRPARDFAQQFGCKSLVYGPPGSGKTPLLNTAPRPVLCAVESGMLSMRGSTIPTWYTGNDPKRVDDFFDWFTRSNEANNFDTLGIDSTAEMAQVYLDEGKRKYSDGRKQHGHMWERTMKHMTDVYYMRNKHVYAICKQGRDENGKQFPSLPGNALNRDVPHKYDFILHLDLKNIPQKGTFKAFQTQESLDVAARNRTGNLDFYEPPDLAALFLKAMTT